MTKDQFISMYSKMFPSGNPSKFSENVFRTFGEFSDEMMKDELFCLLFVDTNRSGTIDFREFMLALHVTSNGSPEEKLAWAFKMYDIDGSGCIDFNEMKR